MSTLEATYRVPDTPAFGLPFAEIVSAMAYRRSMDTPFIQRMLSVREKYNGDQAIMLPNVQNEPSMVVPTARIVTDAVDFLASKSASTRANIAVPAMDLGSEASLHRSWVTRRALYASWYECQVHEVLLRRAYRQYHGYGTFCIVCLPDPDYGVRLQLRDPLATYPEMRNEDDIRPPINVGFVFGRSPEWIAKNYPEAEDLFSGSSHEYRVWDMVEWIDEESVVIGVLGPRYAYGTQDTGNWVRSYRTHKELRRWRNRAGMVPAAIPRRVTLDRVMGQVYSAVGMQQHLERMTALEMTAAEKFVFPDVVVTGRDGRTPLLVSGTWKDGRTGEANFVQDGEVKLLQGQPGPLTYTTMDRIERSARLSAGLVPMAGGETTGSLRTGRAIDTLGGFSVDPRVQEAQEVVGRSLATLNTGVIETFKGYFPARKFTMFSGWPGDGGVVEFTPAEDFETSLNTVSYAFPGSDVSEISVSVGQLVGLRLMSRMTARTKHPMIEDAEHESERVIEEQLEDAALQSVLSQAQSGTLPLIDLAGIIDRYRHGNNLTQAVMAQDQEARARQAASPPPPGEGQSVAPEQAAGLAAPGYGAEAIDQNQPTVGAPPDALGNAAHLFRYLRAGTRHG